MAAAFYDKPRVTGAPMDSAAALVRASALCDLRRWDDAAGQLRTILASDPHNARGLCLMARAQLGQAAYDQALQTSHAAISENPENDWPHRLASLALAGLGRVQEAQSMALSAVRLSPHSPQCHILLAEVLARSGSQLEEARAAADRAVALAPYMADSHIAVGKVAAASGRTEEATAAFHRALALEPDQSVAHNELGRLKLKSSHQTLKRRLFSDAHGLAKAAGGFATAVRADPRAGVSRHNLDLVLRVFLTRAGLGILAVAWIAIPVRQLSDSGLARVLPTLLLVFPAFFAVRFVGGLTPELRGYLMRRLRTRLIAGAIASDAIAVVGLLVGAAFQQATSIAFGYAVAFAIVAVLILWPRAGRKSGLHRDVRRGPPRTARERAAVVTAFATVLLGLPSIWWVTSSTGWNESDLLLSVAIGTYALGLGAILLALRRRGR